MIVALVALRVAFIPSDSNESALRSYQQTAQTLDMSEQLVYRSLLASVADVVDMADQLGQWPEAALLEDADIPPFARGYLPPRTNEFLWVSYDGGTWVDYLGHDQSGRTAVSFILRLIDLHGGYHPHPHPGIDYDPKQTVAAQVWRFPAAQRAYPGERLPEAGWTWVIEENSGFRRPLSSQAQGAQP